MSKSKRICAECLSWTPGDCWFGSDGKHSVMIEAPGFCIFKKDKNGNIVKRKRWNYHPACDCFTKKKKNGFIYQGSGGNTVEQDLRNISELIKDIKDENEEA